MVEYLAVKNTRFFSKRVRKMSCTTRKGFFQGLCTTWKKFFHQHCTTPEGKGCIIASKKMEAVYGIPGGTYGQR